MSFVVPAAQRRLDQVEDTGALEVGAAVDDLLLEPGRRRDRLEGGARRCGLLGGLVVERPGQVGGEGVVVSHVHVVGQAVVIVARVGDAGQRFTGLRIRDNGGAGAGIQGQHGRRQDQVVDLEEDQVEDLHIPTDEGLIDTVVRREDALVIEDPDQLAAADAVVEEEVLVELLAEVLVRGEVFLDVLREKIVDLGGIQVGVVRGERRDIDPVAARGIGEVLLQGDALIPGPGQEGGVLPVDGRAVQDLGLGHEEGVDDVALILLHLIRQCVVGKGIRACQLFVQRREDFPLLGLKGRRQRPLRLGSVVRREVVHVQDIVVEEGEEDVVDRDLDLRRIGRLGSVEFLGVDDVGLQDTGDPLLQHVVDGDLKVLVYGQVDIVACPGIDGGFLIDLEDLAQVIDVDSLLPVETLEGRLHDLLDAGFTDDGGGGVAGIHGLELAQILRRDTAGVADQGSEGLG